MNDLEPIGDLRHPVVRRETCSLAAVRRIAAMLNQDPDKWSEGDLLPRGWQFILLQYSALGFNSHKIHLDRNFAREMEGFPDLVVNGGLATLLLTEFLRLELKGAFTSLTAKHVAPLFCGRPISLWGERQDDAWLLCAFDDNGVLAVDIEARS